MRGLALATRVVGLPTMTAAECGQGVFDPETQREWQRRWLDRSLKPDLGCDSSGATGGARRLHCEEHEDL